MSSNYVYTLTQEGKLISLPADELYHWKYIKREKVDGKWRYTYKDDNVDKTRDNWKAKQRKSYLNRQTANAIRERAINRKLKKQASYAERGIEWVDYVSGWDRLANLADTLATRDEKITQKAKWKYEKAKAKYEKSFGHTVADLLNKRSTINKGKRFVDRLFSGKTK